MEETEGQGSDAVPGSETYRERSLRDDLGNECGQWEVESNSSLNAESFSSARSTPMLEKQASIVSLKENEEGTNPGWSIVTSLSKGLRQKAQSKAAEFKMRKRSSSEEKQQDKNSDSKNRGTPNTSKPTWQ